MERILVVNPNSSADCTTLGCLRGGPWHPQVTQQGGVQHEGFGRSGLGRRGRPGRGRGRVVVPAHLRPSLPSGKTPLMIPAGRWEADAGRKLRACRPAPFSRLSKAVWHDNQPTPCLESRAGVFTTFACYGRVLWTSRYCWLTPRIGSASPLPRGQPRRQRRSSRSAAPAAD